MQRSVITLILSQTTYIMNQPKGLSQQCTTDWGSLEETEQAYMVQDHGKVLFLQTFCSPWPSSSSVNRLSLLLCIWKLARSQQGPESAASKGRWFFTQGRTLSLNDIHLSYFCTLFFQFFLADEVLLSNNKPCEYEDPPLKRAWSQSSPKTFPPTPSLPFKILIFAFSS